MGRRHEYERQQRWQSETAEYTDLLLAAARASPNYSGAELRHQTRELVVFAVGGPTEEASALMREAPSTIRVVWREAPYMLAEPSAEVRRVMHEQTGRLNSGGPRHDGTGIEFTTTDEDLLRADDPRRMLGANYPVAVSYGGAPDTGLMTVPLAGRERQTRAQRQMMTLAVRHRDDGDKTCRACTSTSQRHA